MSGSPLDRRVRRTRRRLKEALAELMDERGYDGLTVREIAERADVGRSTFYDHFESKEHLLFAGVEDHVLALVEGPAAESAARVVCFRFSLPLLRHVREQRRFFETAVFGRSDPRLREICEGILARAVEAEAGRLSADARAPSSASARDLRRGTVRAVVGAFMGLVEWWLKRADHLPAEVVDGIFQRCARPLLGDRGPAPP